MVAWGAALGFEGVLRNAGPRRGRHMSTSPLRQANAVARNRGAWTEDITDWDRQIYGQLISTELTPEQIERIVTPEVTFPREEAVLAVHWHPEFVPTEHIRRRIDAMFPRRRWDLIIPTQHNVLMQYDDHCGVEVDCCSRGFNRKVQLLVHFSADRAKKADAFRAMLAHTFHYRSRQFFEFLDTILEPEYEDRVQQAARRSGAEDDLVAFTRLHARKLKALFLERESSTPPEAIRNKLLTSYFDALRDRYDERMVHHAVMFLRAVKQIVKENFSHEYFFLTEEVIAEARSLGGGVVIPHPEQFWPILLAEYDVDGYEVWNPQSFEYTEFLVNVVARQNRSRRRDERPLLIFMGDDCHMGEKVKDPRYQDPVKTAREIGVQPAWDDLVIRKSLIAANTDRRRVIEEYRARLDG
jgi:hypothetical protein